MKDIAIGMMERADQVCPNDEELRVLMENFKPTAEELQVIHTILDEIEELQAELDELQAHEVSLPIVSVQPEIKVYLLMKNGYPVRSYTDRALSFYECWVCTMGEERAETPDDYYVVEITHDQSIYTGE
jgi:hypothetical protein